MQFSYIFNVIKTKVKWDVLDEKAKPNFSVRFDSGWNHDVLARGIINDLQSATDDEKACSLLESRHRPISFKIPKPFWVATTLVLLILFLCYSPGIYTSILGDDCLEFIRVKYKQTTNQRFNLDPVLPQYVINWSNDSSTHRVQQSTQRVNTKQSKRTPLYWELKIDISQGSGSLISVCCSPPLHKRASICTQTNCSKRMFLFSLLFFYFLFGTRKIASVYSIHLVHFNVIL